MLKLFRYLKPYWWQILILLAATSLQVYTTLRLPALMADIINDGIVKEDTGMIWMVGGKMILFAVVSALGSLISSYYSSVIGAGFSKTLRAELFKKVLSYSMTDMKTFSTASLITRTTNDVTQVRQTFTMILSMMLRAPLFAVISFIMAIETAPDMSWIIAVGLVAIICSIVLIMSLVIPKFRIFQKLLDRTTLLTRENLTGLRVIRAFNNQKVEKRKFMKTNEELTKLLIYVDRILELQNPFINIIFNGTTLLCAWIGISLLSKDIAYLGNMIAFAQYVGHVMMAFLMLSILFVMIPRANVSAERINEVLKLNTKIHWKKETTGTPDKVPSVEFKNVDFMYPDAEEKVLSDVSFVANAGETTAFVGSTGSGKSTLINLVPRFYEATAGDVIVNGIPVKDYEKDDLMTRIGFVPQRGILFSGTVKSNIKFGAPHATDAEVKHAAEVAQADGFISRLPEKYNAHISQGGTNVSGGQKQRLSIARAICKKPQIFVFDDSFSALDMKTDAKLREALKPETEGAVVLIVAQRISTIKDADQIVVLDGGKVVGKGKHFELLNTCPVYEDIVRSQLSDSEFKNEMRLAKNKKSEVKNG